MEKKGKGRKRKWTIKGRRGEKRGRKKKGGEKEERIVFVKQGFWSSFTLGFLTEYLAMKKIYGIFLQNFSDSCNICIP